VAVAVRDRDGTVLSIIDAADGTRRTIASAPNGFPEPSVSPEGKRIAYAAGQFGWDVLEISLPEGQVRTLISGGISRTPDWAPSGTHFIFSIPTARASGLDRQAGSGISPGGWATREGKDPQRSPDSGRFVFFMK
jgi:Tol biopolymer transport system component